METKSNYQVEIDQFRTAFDKYKNKKIVLYGIGRNTATLIPELKDYHLIGLMDKDSVNIGKTLYGIPVLSKEAAEKTGDLIIINTVSAYWDTIYNRIHDVKIPVFFRNGQKAEMVEREGDEQTNPYWQTSLSDLYQQIRSHDVVSFDLFDTLLMRNVYLPEDVLRIAGYRIKSELDIDNFEEIRNRARASLHDRYFLLDELYDAISRITGWNAALTDRIKAIELETEERLLTPRYPMVSAFNYARRNGKEIYIISDMYLPKIFLWRILNNFGISIQKDRLWISGEKKAGKREGTIWKILLETVKGKRVLHIGDDPISDIAQSNAYQIDSFYVMSGKDMLNHSSLKKIAPSIRSLYESTTMGLVLSRLFNDPFALNQRRGRVYFDCFEDLGYSVFGLVVATFLIWLIRKVKSDKVGKLFFFARDGYLLIQNYEFILKNSRIQNGSPAFYLPISRRMAMVASIINRDDLYEVVCFPFRGSFKEYMKNRFDIDLPEGEEHRNEEVNCPGDGEKLMHWLAPYEEEIFEEIHRERNNYLKFLKKMNVNGNFAVVDTGYYGNTQYYLSRLLQKKLQGYYLVANLTDRNRCLDGNKMTPCFQTEDDPAAGKSQLFKKILILESILTAPYGMAKKVDEQGAIIYERQKKNQEYFQQKQQINIGIQEFLSDLLSSLSCLEMIPIEPLFADQYYGIMFDHSLDMSEEIKQTFWSDNGAVQSQEFRIFE